MLLQGTSTVGEGSDGRMMRRARHQLPHTTYRLTQGSTNRPTGLAAACCGSSGGPLFALRADGILACPCPARGWEHRERKNTTWDRHDTRSWRARHTERRRARANTGNIIVMGGGVELGRSSSVVTTTSLPPIMRPLNPAGLRRPTVRPSGGDARLACSSSCSQTASGRGAGHAASTMPG